ncbi:MAG: VOC family protein [Betaproteobacteria bacterium]|nr:VOC family protein [Betaproteobacteria bacterium]
MPSIDIAIPTMPARDLAETIDFYKTLDFMLAYRHPDLDDYVILRRGPLELQFFQWPDLNIQTSFTGCYIRVNDVDAIYQSFAGARLPARGSPSLGGIKRRAWGMREFHLVDCNGNLLRVGEPIAKPKLKARAS